MGSSTKATPPSSSSSSSADNREVVTRMTMNKDKKPVVDGNSYGAKADFAFLSLKGSLVTVCLKNGTRLEGVFDALNHKTRRISLKMVQEHHCPSKGGEEGTAEQIHAFRDFSLADMHSLTSEPSNFAEITGGMGFATDAEISKSDTIKERELSKWQGDGGGNDDDGNVIDDEGLLESSNGPPGTGWDQFGTNKRLFGIETSFDESQYTTAIDKSSEDYRTLEAEAERLAQEITKGVGTFSSSSFINNNNATNIHLAEERGAILDDSQMDEEDRYGAVIRPSSSSSGQKSPSLVSYKQAAMAKNNTQADPVVTMPKSTSSTKKPVEPKLSSPKKLEEEKKLDNSKSTIETTTGSTTTIPLKKGAQQQQQQQQQQQGQQQKRDNDTFKTNENNVSTLEIKKLNDSDPNQTFDQNTLQGVKLNPNASAFMPEPSSNTTVATVAPKTDGLSIQSSSFNPYANSFTPPTYNPYAMPPPEYYNPYSYQNINPYASYYSYYPAHHSQSYEQESSPTDGSVE